MPVLLVSPNGAITQKATLAAAVASGDVAKKTIIVTSDQTINDVTIPSTAAFQILNGAVITVNSGKTLTISGEFQRPSYSCFAGAGAVVLPPGGPGVTQDYVVKSLTLGGSLNEKQGNDTASATTTDIGAVAGNYIKVTGVTPITGLGTFQAGTRKVVEFTGILTLTHNATSLILPTGANITTAAGDTATFISLGAGNWKCSDYQRKDGTALALASFGVPTSGHVILPGGLIMQYGLSTTTIAAGGAGIDITYPIPFPTNILSLTYSIGATSGVNAAIYCPVMSVTVLDLFNVVNNDPDTAITALRWMALGY